MIVFSLEMIFSIILTYWFTLKIFYGLYTGDIFILVTSLGKLVRFKLFLGTIVFLTSIFISTH